MDPLRVNNIGRKKRAHTSSRGRRSHSNISYDCRKQFSGIHVKSVKSKHDEELGNAQREYNLSNQYAFVISIVERCEQNGPKSSNSREEETAAYGFLTAKPEKEGRT